MTGVVCDHYNSCLITPQQTFPNNFQTSGNEGFMKCVSYVPCQQGGFVVGNNYNFSEGYSIDPCCNLNPNLLENNFVYNNNDFRYQGDYNFSNDYSFEEGINFYKNNNTCPPNDNNPKESQQVQFNSNECVKNQTDFFQANGTEVLPQGFNEEFKNVALTPSFFASNSSFKRIPIQPGRSIFRRRRPGDCASEWSNAFDKDYDDGFYLGDEGENN